MKIAIKANPSREKEIISLLESFGGIKYTLNGDGMFYTYYIGKDNIIRYDTPPVDYKVYTLEEFEKEFPFKIGDKVIHKEYNSLFEIIKFDPENVYPYTINGPCEFSTKSCALTKYQPKMKEERNITLTLDKAKEWYNKGGELKEIALQAFIEKELNPLPRSWEEFCMRHGSCCFSTRHTNIPLKYNALLKLEQLRDCWRQGNVPQGNKYKIRKVGNKYIVVWGPEDAFLSFCDKQTAEEFLECFKDLIEQAGDLI